MKLIVNDTTYDVDVPARKTLADTLREDCGLTGTHVGCEQGVCGSCTVLCDGEPVRACLMFAVQCAGVRVRTVEGLAADPGRPHPVQEAFARHGALQCGFCTPGFLMLLAGALAGPAREIDGEIDDERLREIVSANLCRCTGYLSILAAAREAAAIMAGAGDHAGDRAGDRAGEGH
ncbi:MAG TPA: (2Fe-2S)-binding protein [Streptosporangiaceae bacterium]|nr:(2Fe-2S)-binding protein [Streptosporangiaceae bacterium]